MTPPSHSSTAENLVAETPSPIPTDGQELRPNRSMSEEEEFAWKHGSSKFDYYAGYVSNSIMILFLLSRLFTASVVVPDLVTFVQYAAIGWLLWTFAEYWLHRIAYHHGNTVLSAGHHMHHEAPRSYLGLPYYYTFAVYLTLYYVFRHFFDPGKTTVLMAFFWASYLNYNVTHHGTHHWHARNRYFKHMRAHHMVHHRFPTWNFSVTFPLWDHVFRTKMEPNRASELLG